MKQYPDSNGLLLDYSPSMIDAAKNRMNAFKNSNIIQADLSDSKWQDNVNDKPEVVVSGYAIHHLKNGRKYELFEEIFEILEPGGIFVNMDHVSSASKFGYNLFNELIVDTLYAKLDINKKQSKTELMKEHLNEPDQSENILLSVTTQCDWLKEIGFKDVDCFFKCFESCIYAGIKR